MKITIELEANFGHPSNCPVPKYLFERVTKELPKFLEKSDSNFLSAFKVTGVVVK